MRKGWLAAEIGLNAKSRRAAKQSASRGGTGNGKPPVQTTLLTLGGRRYLSYVQPLLVITERRRSDVASIAK